MLAKSWAGFLLLTSQPLFKKDIGNTSSNFRNGYLLLLVCGASVILLALASYITNLRLSGLFEWLQQVFGWGYAFFYCALVSTAVYAWHRLATDNDETEYWLELGQQAAGGIATLSLTFTLLGISLGIGSLSEKTIDPTTVQNIIQELTMHFSTAFMTTVVGLPTSNCLRAIIALRYVRRNNTSEDSSQ